MSDYKISVIVKHPEYEGIKLLLANICRDGLYKINNEIVELEFDKNGTLSCNFINGKQKIPKKYSLIEVGEILLNLENSTVDKVLKYLITPAMEIERIFNTTRYKYLQSIYDSEIEEPSKLISSDCNNAFQALAGIKVYQGNTKTRKANDEFWEEKGFTSEAKNSFETEINDLDFIILYLRNLKLHNFNNIYAELIAIKPGFHEIYIHTNYFDENDKFKTKPKADDNPRDKVFKLLRGYGEISDITLEKLKPHEINRKNYLTYSSCSITEGPFVFRKKLGISYYDEIRKINDVKDKQSLEDNFDIYNYKKPFTLEELENILKETERFKKYCHK
ncbi:MAG: hypothetical protein NTY74_08525 [Ignavibacteriae bacterium]|nr:hypothetical protein [Ignavibacteriota bacterium]